MSYAEADPREPSHGSAAIPSGVGLGSVDENERQRLAECVREPIRTPGAVQVHGVLLVVDPASWTIAKISNNTDRIFGLPVTAFLGKNITEALGMSPAIILSVLDERTLSTNPLAVTFRDHSYDVIVHHTSGVIVLECEPAMQSVSSQTPGALFASLNRLALLDDANELWAETCREVRSLTGFERVMIYHFHADGHGEIVGEDRAVGLPVYLGLHYPASDIPAQARELYLTKKSRMIASTAPETAALLSFNSAGDSVALATAGVPGFDLSRAELRSVSPHHLQFMRNMGQGSTFSLSLIHDGQLTGMITCADAAPRRLPFHLRQGLEILANQVSLQIYARQELDRLARQVHIRRLRAELLTQLVDTLDIPSAVLYGKLTMLDLITAAGAMVSLGKNISTLGATPSPKQLHALAARLGSFHRGEALISEQLSLDFPALGELLPDVAGLLVQPIGESGDFVAWFRPELLDEVNWLGDLTATNRATALSPRNSFTAWTSSTAGRSEPWDGMESEAAEFRRDLDRSLLRRAEHKLAEMAITDDLTGLPNRRLLVERLEHALKRHARGEALTILYLDIDQFKNINDTYGHDRGDALLKHLAKQLRAITRPPDTVARLGGDEFVIVCENTTEAEALVVADRVSHQIRLPSPGSITVTASIGIGVARSGDTVERLLHRADSAMYAAKRYGQHKPPDQN